MTRINSLKKLALTGTAVLTLAACNTPETNETTDKTMTTASTTNQDSTAQSFYDFKVASLDGKEVDFSQYKGKKVLLVNTASECGYTPQYADLQKLHETHGNEVEIVGVPANNFGGQEPGSNEDIAAFCQKNYGVNFQMLDKTSVVGDDRHPLYAWLEQNAPNGEKPDWNFCKYLVDENGKVVAFYNSKVKPMSDEMLAAIQE